MRLPGVAMDASGGLASGTYGAATAPDEDVGESDDVWKDGGGRLSPPGRSYQMPWLLHVAAICEVHARARAFVGSLGVRVGRVDQGHTLPLRLAGVVGRELTRA